MWAADCSGLNSACLKTLLARGADINAADKVRGDEGRLRIYQPQHTKMTPDTPTGRITFSAYHGLFQ